MKKAIALLLALCMVFALAACGQSSAPAATQAPAAEAPAQAEALASGVAVSADGNDLTFTTGGPAGTYYAFGGIIAQKTGEISGTSVTAITSGGSKANIEALEMDDAQLAFVQSDVMSYGYSGIRSFAETGAVTNFSTVAALYMEQVQIVTLNPEIKTIADLEGKRVSIGASGSGVNFNAIDILGAYGLTEADIVPTYQSFDESTEALQDGQIDAAFIVAGAPTTAVTSLAATKPVYLVSLDDEHIATLRETSAYYSKNVIPADVYGTPEDVITVAVGAVVIARDDVDEQDVINFLIATFENDLAHDKSKELDLAFAASVTDVPYHPGAVRYFADKGFEVPGK